MTCEFCKDTGHRLTKNFGTGEFHRIKCHCQFDLPLPFVIQPTKMSCGIAALAMVSAKKFHEVRVLFNLAHDWNKDGMGDYHMKAMFEPLGFSYQVRYQCLHRLGGTSREEWPGKPFAPLHIALVQNLPNTGGHYVVWLPDGRVMDPWWGVLPDLSNYPSVEMIYGLWKIPVIEPVKPVVKKGKKK
jgi:hypothetical protein